MNDDTAPATKADLGNVRQEFQDFRGEIRQEFQDFRTEMHVKLDTHTTEIKRYFDFVVETIRHDLLGANRDQIEVLKDRSANHEERIRRLETSTGMLAA